MDFNRLKTVLDNVLAGFDDKQLNDNPYFRKNNPSAENVARYVFEEIEHKLPGGVRLESVKVVEEPGCVAEFHK